MVALINSSSSPRILSLLVIGTLFCLRLSSFTVNPFVEGTLLNIPVIAADDLGTEAGCSDAKPQSSFDFVLAQTKDLRPHDSTAQPSANPNTPVLYLKEVFAEFYIPPEIVSPS